MIYVENITQLSSFANSLSRLFREGVHGIALLTQEICFWYVLVERAYCSFVNQTCVYFLCSVHKCAYLIDYIKINWGIV